ncbi:MAG: hypothetical protein WBY44_24240 [Bryobacteraceae bacterium]|jgi:hypothetical protein
MAGVLDTNNNFALASAAATLEQAEVIYDVVPIVDGPNNSEITAPIMGVSFQDSGVG